MSAPTPVAVSAAAGLFPIQEFGRSADGLLVARVRDTAFAMVPTSDGRHFLATGWRRSRPLVEWTRSDFYCHSGDVADEAAFRALVEEHAEHQREKSALSRQGVHTRVGTPWGPSQGATCYGDGVDFHSTAGHGGFHLSPERNRSVHALLRDSGGWYEEDAAWAAVAIAWPDLFTGYESRLAEETLRNSWPEAWEAIHGRGLRPGESRERDRQIFEAEHAVDWIVISAVRSDHQPGFTEVIATRSGKRDPQSEERCFLVPAEEYRVGCLGFVVDEARHAPYTGLSSFAGGQVRGAG
ncbi:MAG: hypothetical protein Q7U97_05265 [Rhodocyclaceae bacterium]|nr:hypothetical protein [Rhodocyclaceae bacterium]